MKIPKRLFRGLFKILFKRFKTQRVGINLEKNSRNPILKPNNNYWESQYVLNPAAIYLDNKVHLVYRAIGNDGVSVLGYAVSNDGINIDERINEPIYIPKKNFECRDKADPINFNFISGGGYGGCEDPRLVAIKDQIFMTYTAFNGYEPPRVALSSIKKHDFLNRKWKWKRPILISPHGETHKNWVIFPEKINGHYAILHSISPDILIDYFNDLNFDNKTYINSYYDGGFSKIAWHNKIRGVGPPPIKVKDGWLIFYHAMDKNDSSKYKIGAIILDPLDLTRVLYRAKEPVLEPNELYENQGFKPGIVYVCGAVVIKNQLFVYYGGADTVICVATADLDKFLDKVKE